MCPTCGEGIQKKALIVLVQSQVFIRREVLILAVSQAIVFGIVNFLDAYTGNRKLAILVVINTMLFFSVANLMAQKEMCGVRTILAVHRSDQQIALGLETAGQPGTATNIFH